jgi:hypothetical protein
MKSRSSTGVGMKIDLDYNVETMRISDSGGDEGQTSYRPSNPQPSANNIMSQLKPQSTVVGDITESLEIPEESKRIVADVQGSKLKALLNNLKK